MRGLLDGGFQDKGVDAQVRVLAGPAAVSYKKLQAEADAQAQGPSIAFAPSAGLSALGVAFALLQLIAVAVLLVWFMALKKGNEIIQRWKSLPAQARVFALLGIRVLEVVLCFVDLIVVGTSVLVTTGPVGEDAC